MKHLYWTKLRLGIWQSTNQGRCWKSGSALSGSDFAKRRDLCEEEAQLFRGEAMTGAWIGITFCTQLQIRMGMVLLALARGSGPKVESSKSGTNELGTD